MRAIAIIPARYDSTRFKGKPLADLCGRPMLWWVYHQVKKSPAPCGGVGGHGPPGHPRGLRGVPNPLQTDLAPVPHQHPAGVGGRPVPGGGRVRLRQRGRAPYRPQVIDQVVPPAQRDFSPPI